MRKPKLQEILLVTAILFSLVVYRSEQLFVVQDSAKVGLNLPEGDGSVSFELSEIEGTQTFSRAGPHFAKAKIKTKCNHPRVWLKLRGDAIVSVFLKETTRGIWEGAFTFPVPGTYQVEVQWNSAGCELLSEHEILSIVVVDHPVLGSEPFEQGNRLFADSAWLSTKKLSFPDGSPPYMWLSPGKSVSDDNLLKTGNTTVAIKGTTKGPDNFYKFNDLGNYELLCFVGTQSVGEIKYEFMELRKHLFPGQRPFKFHHYTINNDLLHPVDGWTEYTAKRIRKCKHMIVSVDELQQLSQEQYREQFVNFVNHLLHVMDDNTFPIWILTVNESPQSPTMCNSPTLPLTSDHPCNTVLRQLFAKDSKTFPSRVKLLDNTDISSPAVSLRHVYAVIALRVFVIVGKGVSDWRAMGQAGKIDGLHRNGTVEPNFELIPYEGWM